MISEDLVWTVFSFLSDLIIFCPLAAKEFSTVGDPAVASSVCIQEGKSISPVRICIVALEKNQSVPEQWCSRYHRLPWIFEVGNNCGKSCGIELINGKCWLNSVVLKFCMWGTKFHPKWLQSVAQQHQGSCGRVSVRGELGRLLSGSWNALRRKGQQDLPQPWMRIKKSSACRCVWSTASLQREKVQKRKMALREAKGHRQRWCWVVWALKGCKFLKLEEGEAWIFWVTIEVIPEFAYCGVTVFCDKGEGRSARKLSGVKLVREGYVTT